MNAIRNIIEIDEERCDGCGQCVPSCQEGAIVIRDGKARLVSDRHCDGLGACLGECPRGALRIVTREAEPFDEAVAAPHPASCPGSGCPSAETRPAGAPRAALRNWPVQIRLVSPAAPWLQRAHLLITADCVPVACAGFHERLAGDNAVLMGCPKFDPQGEYAHKFGELFAAADIERVTVAVMEVPCCQGLPRIVQAGMALAGKTIPMEVVVAGFDGSLHQHPDLHMGT